ncbi:putative xylosidase arabinosidase [Rosellinia necatrix]|uniref:Putative xylosidase arabinosidase n=1 Tax=Rosellinia necatrix TaxID=77044 RepID=A0A1S8A6Y4_ROSNE|nr:putative xylosidase arabinosidase [Rosellinia necatrix]
MLLRKQSSYAESFEAKMQFRPRKTGYEAGIVIWWNQYSYASYGLVLCEGSDGEQALTTISRVPTGRVGEMTSECPDREPHDEQDAKPKILLGDTIRLRIEAFHTEYQISIETQNHTSVRNFQTKKLTVMPPIGGAFCGTMFGVYSFGRAEPVLDPADFFDIIIKAI